MSKLLRYQVLLHRVTEQAHTLDDLLEGRTTVDVEGDSGRDVFRARQLGLFTANVKGVDIIARCEADAAPLIHYLEQGGVYGSLDFSRLLGYSEEQVEQYAELLKLQAELGLPPWGYRKAFAPRVASRYLQAAESKYDHIDFQPPKSVAEQAEKGLKLREKASPSNRGGLTSQEAGKQGIGSGVQRAVNLKNRDNVTPETISKMLGFFARHEKNKGIPPEHKDEPWNAKGYVAWLLWGGDAGLAWAKKVKEQMEKADEAEKGKTAHRVASQWLRKASNNKNVVLMRFLSDVSKRLGFGEHTYVVGGAVRNWILNVPIKDIDMLVDTVALGHSSEWVAQQIAEAIPAETNLTTNQYGVAILTVKSDWVLGDHQMQGEVIEIAAARKESYGGEGGKGYKPHMVEPATVQEDVARREFTFNTLMWRLMDLTQGPDKAQVIDLTGCGLQDLQEGTMRCPSDPDKTFGDDPSRLIRLVKFAGRFGFKVPPDTLAAARRQAPKIKNIPHNAVSKLLAEVLVESKAKQAIDLMSQIGLLEPLREMVEDTPAFRDTLSNWANQQSVQYLFLLMDTGLIAKAKVNFLDPAQQARVRELAAHMTSEEAENYLAALKQPGRVLDIPSLSSEFGLKGTEVRVLMEKAREALLAHPQWMSQPASLEEGVRKALRGQMRLAYEGKEQEGLMTRRPEASVGKVAARWLKAGQNPNMVTSIVMFDFDGTLFRSPDRPEWWNDPTKFSWGRNLLSLSPPCVPENPSSEFWNPKAVSYARSVTSDPEAILVIVTARTTNFKQRVPQLLSQQGIRADRSYFNPGSSATTYKMGVFEKLLEEFPLVDTIVIWEDQHLSYYKSSLNALAEKLGRPLKVIPHPVAMEPIEPACSASEFEQAARVASRHLQRQAGVTDWLKWIVQPFAVLIKHHREFVYGPVDDAFDAVLKELAPKLVRALAEKEVDADVDEFLRGAIAGRDSNPMPSSESEDFRAGYVWGANNKDDKDLQNGDLPDYMERQVVQSAVDTFRKRITETVLKEALKKAWHAINPMTTFKAIKEAVKKHGWKLGVGFALFELFEHFVLPAVLSALFDDPRLLSLATLPIGEVIYAVVFRILGKVPAEVNKAEEDGHLDWYEQQFGPIRLAALPS